MKASIPVQCTVCKEILQWQKAWSCPEAQPIKNTQRCTVFCQAKTADKLEASMEIFYGFFSRRASYCISFKGSRILNEITLRFCKMWVL